MTGQHTPFTLIRAARVIDGHGGGPQAGIAVLVEGTTIKAIGPRAEIAPPDGAPCLVLEYPQGTLLPGLIDTHTHLNGFGDGRAGDDLAMLPDEILLLQSAANARTHLTSGVTTLRDCGSKGQTAFRLRQAATMGITDTPRLVLCGRPVTITGGHLWYFGAEADGPDAGRRTVRQLIKEGADFIKLTATGGSTRTSFPTRPSFSPDELRAIVDEAHAFGKPTAAHCTSSQGVRNAVEAGIDTIIHCTFAEPDGTPVFHQELAEQIAARGCWVDFTIAQLGMRQRLLEERQGRGETLAADEAAELDRIRRTRDVRQDHFQRLLAMGVRMVSGSDSSWSWYPMGHFQEEVIGHAEWGMTALDALLTATRDAAACLGLAGVTGTLAAGKVADLLVVAGDPALDIGDLRRVVDVFLAGRRVPRPAAGGEAGHDSA
jgi:imidazolonepropionase-like amidohydrolase